MSVWTWDVRNDALTFDDVGQKMLVLADSHRALLDASRLRCVAQ